VSQVNQFAQLLRAAVAQGRRVQQTHPGDRKTSQQPRVGTALVELRPCAECGTLFRARVCKGIWPKFCSSACYGKSCRRRRACSACGAMTGNPKFCSAACTGLGQRLSVKATCGNCGVGFNTTAARLACGRGRFCSKGCASSANCRAGQIGNPVHAAGLRHFDELPGFSGRFPRVGKTPLGRRVRKLVQKAIASGQLVRPESCARCERTCRPHAHHADYLKPLEVEWLCGSCHMREHLHSGRTFVPGSAFHGAMVRSQATRRLHQTRHDVPSEASGERGRA